jgi:hypothetical protein
MLRQRAWVASTLCRWKTARSNQSSGVPPFLLKSHNGSCRPTIQQAPSPTVNWSWQAVWHNWMAWHNKLMSVKRLCTIRPIMWPRCGGSEKEPSHPPAPPRAFFAFKLSTSATSDTCPFMTTFQGWPTLCRMTAVGYGNLLTTNCLLISTHPSLRVGPGAYVHFASKCIAH